MVDLREMSNAAAQLREKNPLANSYDAYHPRGLRVLFLPAIFEIFGVVGFLGGRGQISAQKVQVYKFKSTASLVARLIWMPAQGFLYFPGKNVGAVTHATSLARELKQGLCGLGCS